MRVRGRVFIGHGRSPLWRELKDFLQERLQLEWDEFNRAPAAGLATKERLVEMLDSACFAFLIMTAEESHADGMSHARGNVIHEVGLFQGKLGFERAIVLLETGCAEFSNIVGLSQIRFPQGNISAVFEEIRRVLEREDIPGDGEFVVDRIANQSSLNEANKISVNISNRMLHYLMTWSRPRNQQGLPIGYFDNYPSRENEEYQAMVDQLCDLGLMRLGSSSYVLTKRGYELTDTAWMAYILNAVGTNQSSEYDYVSIGVISNVIVMNDGEQEAIELKRLLAELESHGMLELVTADTGPAAARLTLTGHAKRREYHDWDFTPPG